jgi:translation initiation factor 6
MEIELGTVKSSPFVGVFAVVTDKVALFPRAMEQKEKRKVESLFGVDVVYASLANSSLLGVLAVGNSRGFAVSEIAAEKEIDELQGAGLRIKKVSGITALGNLVECNDKKAFCSRAIPAAERNAIGKALGVECIEAELAGSGLVGSGMLLTNKGFITNPMASEAEFKLVESKTGLHGAPATANYGDRFVGNSVIANSNAALAGIYTTGHELIRIDEGLSGR